MQFWGWKPLWGNMWGTQSSCGSLGSLLSLTSDQKSSREVSIKCFGCSTFHVEKLHASHHGKLRVVLVVMASYWCTQRAVRSLTKHAVLGFISMAAFVPTVVMDFILLELESISKTAWKYSLLPASKYAATKARKAQLKGTLWVCVCVLVHVRVCLYKSKTGGWKA